MYSGANMSFLVLGRQHVCKPEYTPEIPHIVISITDPDEPEAYYVPTDLRQDILRLSFFDINESIGNLTMVNDNDIDAIIDFVNTWKDKVPLIVTQCEAGISRSSGVAAGLSQWLNNDSKFFFDTYLPNSLVYSKLVKKLLDVDVPPPEPTLYDNSDTWELF